MTFWDAGEFIAAADGFGIPHPPGTPLYVALGRTWTLLLAPVAGAARAMNLLSALCTAVAGALTARLVARATRGHEGASWGAAAGAVCAGLMATAWANATETEVYAVALLHVVVLLECGARAGALAGRRARRWLLCTAYLIVLAPAVHLSALVGAPAAIALASRDAAGRWRPRRVLLLGGALVLAAGIGRVSAWLALVGVLLLTGAAVLHARRAGGDEVSRQGAGLARAAGRATLALLAVGALAASALLIMLVRARHDPPLDQGNPATLAALLDVVSRRQYDVAGLFPRQTAVWWQLANVAQYADWQVALAWGRGIFTMPARVVATATFVLIAAVGVRAMRRDARPLAEALLVLLVCGTLGVAAYLNFKAGASLGWGVLPDSAPHEARERDYFFVLGFWAWGCFAGYGALAMMRARRWPPALAVALVVVPLVGNWPATDRSREPVASAARTVATALLADAPPRALLFLAGDNDSYPLWYAQQVEGQRPDVTLATLSLLPAAWYRDELSRRTGLRWRDEPAPPARWQHEQVAGQLAAAARRAGRPVAATPGVTSAERALLGSGWRLEGVVYRATAAAGASAAPAVVDTATATRWLLRAPPFPPRGPRGVDDVSADMLTLLACPRLGAPWRGRATDRDSLEVKCNLR